MLSRNEWWVRFHQKTDCREWSLKHEKEKN